MGVKVRIPKEKCPPNLTQQMIELFGYGTWKEWMGFIEHPDYVFEFDREEDAMIFILRWA
jgi:hypothetical protein